MDVIDRVNAANASSDWRTVLKWEGRMEEMMANQPDASCLGTLAVYRNAHFLGFSSTSNAHNLLATVALQDRQISLLGKMQRFRDQGEIMCTAAGQVMLSNASDRKVLAARYYQTARNVGAAHGFFSVESRACTGLGQLSLMDGRDEEAVDLLRNALAGHTRNPALYALSAPRIT
jgi:hypothetical protein